MKIVVARWKIATYGAWGTGAVMAFIGSFLPWVEIHLAYGATYVISGTTDVAETTTLTPCRRCFRGDAYPAHRKATRSFALPRRLRLNCRYRHHRDYQPATHRRVGAFQRRLRFPSASTVTGNGVRLVLVGGIVSCVGSFAFPLLGLWHHYRKVVTDEDAPVDASVTGCRILRRRPSQGEDTLFVYVADTGSTATTFVDTSVTAPSALR